MARLYKRSDDGLIVCGDCLPPQDRPTSAELFPKFFPGTYDKLNCTTCGAAGDPDALTAEHLTATPLAVGSEPAAE